MELPPIRTGPTRPFHHFDNRTMQRTTQCSQAGPPDDFTTTSQYVFPFVSAFIRKLYPIITQLTEDKRGSREFSGELVNQDRRHRRDCSLFPIDAQFPKLDVAGSIPVSRSFLSITWEHPYKSLPQFCRVNSRKPFPEFLLPEYDSPMAFARRCSD
jgi:hypothetical protein